MSATAKLLTIEAHLRRAVREGGFPQTPELLERYMGELRGEVSRVVPGSVAARDLEAQATALFDWIRVMACVSLAHDAAELERLPSVAAFGNPEPRLSQSAIDA